MPASSLAAPSGAPGPATSTLATTVCPAKSRRRSMDCRLTRPIRSRRSGSMRTGFSQPGAIGCAQFCWSRQRYLRAGGRRFMGAGLGQLHDRFQHQRKRSTARTSATAACCSTIWCLRARRRWR
jgi:hypothetical protein